MLLDSSYPGVIFCNKVLTYNLTSAEATFDHLEDLGISASVPENSVHSEDTSSDVVIQPCFTGPFQLPDDYEQASPAFLINHGKICFQKAVTIKMCHYVNLKSEEDCKSMAFFTASFTPKYVGSKPFYVCQKMPKTNDVFKPGQQVGETTCQHFCFIIIGQNKQQSGRTRHNHLKLMFSDHA